MRLAIAEVLSAAEVGAIREVAASLDFADGRETAGRYARAVKANAQAAPSPDRDAVLEKVRRAILGHAVFASAVRPAELTPLILSRYRPGESYGLHVDDALMGGVRTDVSFTLFLSDPESYEGGELEMEDTLEARRVKLPAGSLFLYPSTTLHRVVPVTSGERLAVVGWARSRVREAERREILFDLDRAVEGVFGTEGKTPLFDTLAKTRSNLLRMWAD